MFTIKHLRLRAKWVVLRWTGLALFLLLFRPVFVLGAFSVYGTFGSSGLGTAEGGNCFVWADRKTFA